MLTYRSVKGSPLTCEEIDENFKSVQNFKGSNPPTNDIGVNGDTYVKYKTYKDIADLNTFTYTEVNYKSDDIDTTKMWTCLPKNGKGSFEHDESFWYGSEINPIKLISYFVTGSTTKKPKKANGDTLRDEPALVLIPNFPSDVMSKPEVSFKEYSSLIPTTSIILNGDTYSTEENYFPKARAVILQSDYITNLYNKIDSEIKVSIIFKSKKVLEKEDYYKEDGIWKKVMPKKNIFTLRNNNGLYPTVFGHNDLLTIGKNAVDFSTNSDKKIGAIGNYSFVEGSDTSASGINSHAEGNGSTAAGKNSHAEGSDANASGNNSHAEGYFTEASGLNSHAEGDDTKASALNSHAEGNRSKASGEGSHAEGRDTKASGGASHAEGRATEASGSYSHTEGNSTKASGKNSHAEGNSTTASEAGAHAEGEGTIALNYNSHAAGNYNVGASHETIHETGVGTSDSDRKNAFEIYRDGRVRAPELLISKIDNDKSLITKEYLEANSNIKVKQSLPLPSLVYFEKAIYSIEDGAEYICVSNVETPSHDTDCFWVEC